MRQEEIRQTIARFPRWHYQFDLKGNLTPIFDQAHINRHNERKRYFFDPMVELMGGALKGKRVLDLGCNAGFWSLQALQNGCDFVLGLDARSMHIDQANFVCQALEIEQSRYQFVRGNLFEVDFRQFGDFDIILCLGLMYHISKHVTLMEKIVPVSTDILVIDTHLSRKGGSYLEVRRESLEDPRNAADYNLIMVPTRRAVIDLVVEFGYSVAVLKPRFLDYTGAVNYRKGTRKAFLCAKKTGLAGLRAEVELAVAPADVVCAGDPPLKRWLKALKRRFFV